MKSWTRPCFILTATLPADHTQDCRAAGEEFVEGMLADATALIRSIVQWNTIYVHTKTLPPSNSLYRMHVAVRDNLHLETDLVSDPSEFFFTT